MMKCSMKALAVVGAAALLFPLAACGAGSVSSGKEITFFANNTKEAYKPVLDGFAKANPDIKIKFTTTNGAQAGYQQTLQTRISGGQLADVFVAPPEQLSVLVKNKVVKDLTNEPFMKSIGDTNKQQSKIDGKIWSMSTTAWSNAFAYNKDLLHKAGYDNIPETWDEFLVMLKKLKDAGVQKPYLEPKSGLGAPVEAWIGNDSTGQSRTIDQQIGDHESSFVDSYTKYYEQWQKLFAQNVMSSDVTGLGDDQVRSEFASGRLAVMPSGYWDVKPFKQSGINFAFGRIPMLHKGDESWAPGSADSGYAINAKISGDKLASAEKFLSYLASDQGLKAIQKGAGLIPSTKTFTAAIDPTFKEPYNLYFKTGHVYLNSLGWPVTGRSTLRGETYSQLQKVALGQITPAEAAKDLDAKFKTLS